MPKVRLRRLLPPRLLQDASLPIILRIDLASKRSLGITLSHSATNKRWRVASIQKGAVMPHNVATSGRDKVLTGDTLYSINGRTDDLDLELDKPGPHVVHIQRLKGSQTLDVASPVGMRVWARNQGFLPLSLHMKPGATLTAISPRQCGTTNCAPGAPSCGAARSPVVPSRDGSSTCVLTGLDPSKPWILTPSCGLGHTSTLDSIKPSLT